MTSPSRSWGFGGVKWQCMPPGTPERCHLFFLQRMLLENGLNSLENAMEKGAIAQLKKSRKQWARSFNLSTKRTQFYPLDYQGLHAPMVWWKENISRHIFLYASIGQFEFCFYGYYLTQSNFFDRFLSGIHRERMKTLSWFLKKNSIIHLLVAVMGFEPTPPCTGLSGHDVFLFFQQRQGQ